MRAPDGYVVDGCVRQPAGPNGELESETSTAHVRRTDQPLSTCTGRKGITGIPLFCFSIPEVGLWSGPFREANADAVVNGSANRAQFLHLFEQLYKYAAKQLGDGLKRVQPPPSSSAEAAAETAEAAEAAAAGDATSFVGQEVRLVGLQAKPELNGAVGVCERLDAKQGRYAVRLPGHEKPIAIKAANLERVDGGGKDEL